MIKWFESKVTKYLDYWHGTGDDPEQYRYYRCEGCLGLVTWKKIRQGGCDCGISRRIRPAIMNFKDKARCLLMPWTI